MTHPLWPRMNAALNALELMSETSAANLAPSTGGGKPGSKMLKLTAKPERDHWLEQWNRAVIDRDRERAVQGAEAALRQVTHSQAVEGKPETAKERTARILHRNHEGATPHEVALSMWGDVTVRMVVEARKENDRDPMTGREWRQGEDNEAKAQRLVASGMSMRQTATILGLHMEQVRRLVKRAA